MAKHTLTQEHIDQLRVSPYILSVTQSQIRYTDELKALYYQQKDQFESGMDWLRSVGLGPELIGRKRAASLITLLNHYPNYQAYLEAKKAKNDPMKISDKERIKRLEHQLKYAEQEIRFLKKHLDRSDAGQILSNTQVKYSLIEATLNEAGNLLSLYWLCKVAGVSRSGYYNWLNVTRPNQQQRDQADQEDFKTILKAFLSTVIKKEVVVFT